MHLGGYSEVFFRTGRVFGPIVVLYITTPINLYYILKAMMIFKLKKRNYGCNQRNYTSKRHRATVQRI